MIYSKLFQNLKEEKSQYIHSHISTFSYLPTAKDTQKEKNFKIVNKIFLEFLKKKPIEILETERKAKIERLFYVEDAIQGILYDEKEKNFFKLPIFEYYPEIKRTIDEKKYNFISKKNRYDDISVFQILKILFKKNRISKGEYKNSIKRLKEKKPLQNRIFERVNIYYHTIKSHPSRNTISSLTRQESRLKNNFFQTKYKNQFYSVKLKKFKFACEFAEQEFINKIKIDNSYIKQ
jgi:hypothetical protein